MIGPVNTLPMALFAFCLIITVMAHALGFALPAMAHSWYPHYCCSDQDCMKVDFIEPVDGGIYMSVGALRVFVPEAMEKRPSQDNDAHICLLRTQSGRYRVRCVFLPGIA